MHLKCSLCEYRMRNIIASTILTNCITYFFLWNSPLRRKGNSDHLLVKSTKEATSQETLLEN